jgi:putative copper export protein
MDGGRSNSLPPLSRDGRNHVEVRSVDEGQLTLLSLWIHIPIVTAWIGMVMIDLFASSAPGFNIDQRGRMIAWFRPFVIAAIGIILVTGIWQTMKNPFSEVSSYAELSDLRDTTYGFSLFVKHIFVVATFLLTLIVHFYFAPRLMKPSAVGAPGGPAVSSTLVTTAQEPVARDLVATRWLSILNVLACVGALIMATRMIWELH